MSDRHKDGSRCADPTQCRRAHLINLPPVAPSPAAASAAVTTCIDALSKLSADERNRALAAVRSFFADVNDVSRRPLGGPSR